jgi:hypothetical protein
MPRGPAQASPLPNTPEDWDLTEKELEVLTLLAQGMTNEQIAGQLGFHDKRAVSRTNGQIYTAWGLNDTPTDEKVARTRAAVIYHRRQLIADPIPLFTAGGSPELGRRSDDGAAGRAPIGGGEPRRHDRAPHAASHGPLPGGRHARS